MLGTMSFVDARAHAAELEKAALTMEDSITELRNAMTKFSSDLKSDGSTKVQEAFDILNGKLPSFPSKVRDFKNFLLASVAQYESELGRFTQQI